MARLAPIPQRYRVKKDLTHATNERYVQERRVLYPEKTEVNYATGNKVILRSVFVEVEVQAGDDSNPISLWVWTDGDGWIIRPGVLEGYVSEGRLEKI
jgi:hypothetical protein